MNLKTYTRHSTFVLIIINMIINPSVNCQSHRYFDQEASEIMNSPTPKFSVQEFNQIDDKTRLSDYYSPEQEFLFNVFKNRRSVRKFKPTNIPQDHILKILDIARTAPTAGNQQPWKFLVIQDRKMIQQLKERQITSALKNMKMSENIEAMDSMRNRIDEIYAGYLSAPLCIVVLTDKESKYPAYNIMDGTLAAGYLIIAARALGYGTVFATDSFSEEIIRELFDIPDNLKQICFIPVGVPEEWPVSPEKKPLEDFIAFEHFTETTYDQPDDTPKFIKLKPEILENYIGKYDYKGELIIEIIRKDSSIYMQSLGSAPVELFPLEEDKFSLKDGIARITFIRNSDGQVIGLNANQQGLNYNADKIE